MTRAGYEKKRAELDHLQNVEMVEITKKVAEARAEGDLKENAEYHASRERQGMLQAKINLIKDELSRAEIINPEDLPRDTVVFGAKVLVKDLEYQEDEWFELVGPGQEDYDNNKILTTSPMGEGLIGKKVGDIAEIDAPAGKIRFEILEITFPMLDS